MKMLFKKVAGLTLAASLMASAAQADTIRIALAETPSAELAAFFVALERAKANGLDYEWTAFADEELAIQAVSERPDGYRLWHPLFGDATLEGADPDHLSAVQAGVLSGHHDGLQRAERP